MNDRLRVDMLPLDHRFKLLEFFEDGLSALADLYERNGQWPEAVAAQDRIAASEVSEDARVALSP